VELQPEEVFDRLALRECVEIREHVKRGLYPELAEQPNALRTAVILCSQLRFDAQVPVLGEFIRADELVAVADLMPWVERRLAACWN
jgi:hypothetical protein